MGPGRTSGNNHTIQVMLLDLLLQDLLSILGTAVEALGVIDNPFHAVYVIIHRRHINNTGDINAAVTDKDTDSRLFIFFKLLLFRVFLDDYSFASFLFQDTSGKTGGSA